MGIPVLILGRSGSGKSRGIKNLDCGVIKVIEKELPFKNNFKTLTTSDYGKIVQALMQAKKNSIVIDDAGYLLTLETMGRRKETGYGKFTDMAHNYYDLIQYIIYQVPANKIVYIVMHEEENEMTGEVKPKTTGKMLNDVICIEGLVTIALRCYRNDLGKHCFVTNGKGAKTPEDMFTSEEIDNDLKMVDDTIREFYNIPRQNKETKEEKGE